MGISDTLEGGESITYGASYSLNNQSNRQVFSASLANVFRIEEDNNMPLSSSLGQKTSNVVSTIKMNQMIF